MLKNWILAAALAALPFAAVAKKPAEAKTAAVQQTQSKTSIADMVKAVSNLSEEEKAVVRKMWLGTIKAQMQRQAKYQDYGIEFQDGNTLVYLFLYNKNMQEMNQVLGELLPQETAGAKNEFAALTVLLEQMVLTGLCSEKGSEALLLLKVLGISHFAAKIVDGKQKVLAETPRQPMPDCAAK